MASLKQKGQNNRRIFRVILEIVGKCILIPNQNSSNHFYQNSRQQLVEAMFKIEYSDKIHWQSYTYTVNVNAPFVLFYILMYLWLNKTFLGGMKRGHKRGKCFEAPLCLP